LNWNFRSTFANPKDALKREIRILQDDFFVFFEKAAMSNRARPIPFLMLLLGTMLTACSGAPSIQQPDITVSIIADQASQEITLPAGSTVQAALNTAKVELSQTDRVNPASFTVLTGGEIVTVTRVREEFENQQVILPFERTTLRNESLPAGETLLVQAGENGLGEVTMRHV
jgi:hypothetical protein